MDKVETLKRYKFSLAFENSNEEDYVTEKYFQSLVAGMKLLSVSLYPGPLHHADFVVANLELGNLCWKEKEEVGTPKE